MTTTSSDVYRNPISDIPFIRKKQAPVEILQEIPQLTSEAVALIQKVQNVERALGLTTIEPTSIPAIGEPVLRQGIARLRAQLPLPAVAATVSSPGWSLEALLSWLGDSVLAIATTVYKVARTIFTSRSSEPSIDAILDELRISQAISPVQHEAILALAKEPEKKPALMLLATFLGFSSSELSPLLSTALTFSSEHAFSLLLECFLIKKFSASRSLEILVNNKDRQTLSSISFETLRSHTQIQQQLECLQSLSYRASILSWIEHLPALFRTDIPPQLVQECSAALRNNDAKTFLAAISPFLTDCTRRPISNETIYAQELFATLSSGFSFKAFATEIRRQKFISQWSDEIIAIKKSAETLIATHKCARVAHRTISSALSLINNEHVRRRYAPTWTSMCPTFRATQEGSIARNIRKIEALNKRLSSELGIEQATQDSSKPWKHVLHLACSCGGGHTGMVAALNGSLRASSAVSSHQYTSEALDVPTQVTQPVDTVHMLFQKLGLNIDTTWVYNFLLRNDLCSVIEFLKWLTSGDPDESSTVKKQSLIRQAILTRDPDFLNMVYAFDGNDIDAVSQQLGLPLLYVATDLDLSDWRRIPTSPFFREAVPTLQHPDIRRTLRVPEQQVEEIGLCVGPEFETPLSSSQLEGVRARYGIGPNEKVVVVSNGGTALQNSIPERIALEYNDRNSPIHLIVICGKNESFKEYLETKVRSLIPQQSPVRMTVLGFQQRVQMAELTQLADVVVGKPGGMSTMEFVKSGARVIFDETSFRMHWERFNADVVVHSGRGTILNSPSQIIPLITESLKMPRRSLMQMAQIRASERYAALVDRLLAAANRPRDEEGWREKRRSWHIMNKQLARLPIG